MIIDLSLFITQLQQRQQHAIILGIKTNEMMDQQRYGHISSSPTHQSFRPYQSNTWHQERNQYLPARMTLYRLSIVHSSHSKMHKLLWYHLFQ